EHKHSPRGICLGAAIRRDILFRWPLVTNLVIALGVAAVVGALLLSDALVGQQRRATDSLFRAQPAEPAPRTVIVAVDERSLDALRDNGRPNEWPRAFHARVIDNLVRAGARVIVLDVLMDLPSTDDAALAHSIS